MTDLLFARMQMGMTLRFHIVFAIAGMSMPLLMATAHWHWCCRGLRNYPF